MLVINMDMGKGYLGSGEKKRRQVQKNICEIVEERMTEDLAFLI